MDRFEKNIARGLCPKCETTLNINKDDISISCKVCGLEINLNNFTTTSLQSESEQHDHQDCRHK